MSSETPQACEIIVTGPADDTLDTIASELVDARLIACANVLSEPVTSTFRWQGTVEVEPEKRMHMHTRLDLVDEVVAFVNERHPYDVPNVTAIPLVAGNAEYLAWIGEETRRGTAG
ncbi:MAG TPA: divalent-cation tolerance protein CutA [Solirubrobacteraceae bacterium]|nr:divalent-cation tolerance protein CutA [Solirubrobacteraceae bacterium]